MNLPFLLDYRARGEESKPANPLRGSPVTRVANQYVGANGHFFCGIWESTVGAWEVNYTEEELCVLLAGKVRLIARDGETREFKAGDSFISPAGFIGVWETLEPVRKLYAVAEASI
jgi:hypothetical protein